MILDHHQLETAIESSFRILRNPEKISLTCLISGPSCGKSTLIEAIKLATVNVRGFVITDMSDIIDWHRDPKNNSMLRENFEAAEEIRKRGDLVDDYLIFAGFMLYLDYAQGSSPFGELRKVLVSGLPRKDGQGELLLKYFQNVLMGYINCPMSESDLRRLNRIANGVIRSDDKPDRFAKRWKNFDNESMPYIEKFKSENPKRFVTIGYKLKPEQKAVSVLKSMRLSDQEYCSMLHQLITPKTEAWKRLDRVFNPQDYPGKAKPVRGHCFASAQLQEVFT